MDKNSAAHTFDHFIELDKVDGKLEDITDDENQNYQGEGRGHCQVSPLPAVQGESEAAFPGKCWISVHGGDADNGKCCLSFRPKNTNNFHNLERKFVNF